MKKIIILIIILIPTKIYAISASSYIVMDSDNNRVLEGNNIHKESLIASTTKIMTALVTINNFDLSKEIEVGPEIYKSYGSGIYIEIGEHVKLEDLLYGLMLRSGNDAAITIAHHTSNNMESFVYLMNEQAKILGMNNTNFINNHGLEENDKGNTSTCYDMALLSSYAIKNKKYKEIVGTKERILKTDKKTYKWYNKNKLLQTYKYCTGGKTGYTKKAKRTLVTNASKNNINLTIVTINDREDFKDHEELYNKYFNKLKNYKIITKGKIETNYPNTYIKDNYTISLTKEEYKKIKKEIIYTNNKKTVGYISITLNNKELKQIPIYQKSIQKKESFITKILKLFK